MSPKGDPRDVLHHEVTGSGLRHESEEVEDERISLVIDQSLTNGREALAWWTAENEVQFPIEGAGSFM
jgi:hypothetical protein